MTRQDLKPDAFYTHPTLGTVTFDLWGSYNLPESMVSVKILGRKNDQGRSVHTIVAVDSLKTWNRNMTREAALDVYGQIECDLSPENLCCDGELSRAQVARKYKALMKRKAQIMPFLGGVEPTWQEMHG